MLRLYLTQSQENLALLTDTPPLMEPNGMKTATLATVPMGKLCVQRYVYKYKQNGKW